LTYNIIFHNNDLKITVSIFSINFKTLLYVNSMKNIFTSLLLFTTVSFPCIAQKTKVAPPKQEPILVNAAPKSEHTITEDTAAVRFADKQAVSGFNITQYVASNFQYPPEVLDDSNFISVRIMVEFIVEKDASISSVNIKKVTNNARTTLLPNTERLLKYEVLRVVRRMPAWQSPAYQNGQAVRSYFNLPLLLKLD